MKNFIYFYTDKRKKNQFFPISLCGAASLKMAYVSKVADLDFIPDFLYPIHAEIDSGLVHWLTNVAEVGQMFIHRKGCIVRMQDSHKTLHEEDL